MPRKRIDFITDILTPFSSAYNVGNTLRKSGREEDLRNAFAQSYDEGAPETITPTYDPAERQGMAPTQPIVTPARAPNLNMQRFLQLAAKAGVGPEAMALSKKDKVDMGPSSVQEWEYFSNKLTPEQKQQFLRLKRADKFLDVGSGFVTPDQLDPTKTKLVAPRGLKPTEELGYVAGKETTEKKAAAAVAKQTLFPKTRETYISLNKQWDLVDSQLDKAIAGVGPWTSGVGAWVSIIPATPQKDLSETLKSIAANIGFDKLQDMRANSPTGGALGQVSDFENRLLQAVKGSLVQDQSPKQLRENLINIKKDLAELKKQKQKAFETDFSDFMPRSVDSIPGQRSAPQSAIDYLKRNDSPIMRQQFQQKYGYLP